MYEDVDPDMPKVSIPKEEQDSHSKRLLKACDLWDQEFSETQVKRAKRAYYGAVSYVDDCIGNILQTLKDCGLADNTIVVFSGDHGDMLGERGLWYKMSYFESSVRVPLLVHYPKEFAPRRVSENVSTLDILPTLVDLAKTQVNPDMPLDGRSLFPLLNGGKGNDTVFAEYCGEGTVAPLMMIKRGDWKYITCPADPDQLYNLRNDPDEIINLAKSGKAQNQAAIQVLHAFQAEAAAKWDMKKITQDVLLSQKQRIFVWGALKIGKHTSWDFNPEDDGREKYIRSHMPLDQLELKARFPPVDTYGHETKTVIAHQAAALGQ